MRNRESIGERASGCFGAIIGLGLFVLIIWFLGKIYFSNNYSFFVSMKASFKEESLHNIEKEGFPYYSERNILSKVMASKIDEIKGKKISISSNILKINREESYITVIPRIFKDIKCDYSLVKDKSTIESLSDGENVIVCGELTEVSREKINIKVSNISICDTENPEQYDYADEKGELYYGSSWIEKQFGNIIFKLPGWWQANFKYNDTYMTCNLSGLGYFTIYWFNYNDLKAKSEKYDGSPIEWSDDTRFNLYLLEKINGSHIKYSTPRSERVNGIDFTYYRGEASFLGSGVNESYFTIVNDVVTVFSLKYSGDFPEESNYIAKILGSARIVD